MSDKTIEAALQYGLALGNELKPLPVKEPQASVDEDYQSKLVAIFNFAAQFKKGLEKLHEIDPTFTVEPSKIVPESSVDVSEWIVFKTNVPLDEKLWDKSGSTVLTAKISVPRKDYEPGCFGGGNTDSHLTIEVSNEYSERGYLKKNFGVAITSPRALENALAFIAEEHQRQRVAKTKGSTPIA